MAAVLAEPAAVFTFSNYLDPKRFAIAAGIRIGLFIVSIVIFPLLLWGIANASGCRGVGGACGALGLVVAMAYKPLVAVAFIFSFAGISVRRARDAGVPGWVGLFVPLLFAANHAVLTVFGAPWSLGFSLGVLHTAVPRFTIMALWCIGAMCLLPSRADDGEGFGLAGRVAAGLAVFVSIFAALQALSAAPALAALLLPLQLALSMLLRPAHMLLPAAMLALGGLLAWLAWIGRGARRTMPLRPSVPVAPQLARPEPVDGPGCWRHHARCLLDHCRARQRRRAGADRFAHGRGQHRASDFASLSRADLGGGLGAAKLEPSRFRVSCRRRLAIPALGLLSSRHRARGCTRGYRDRGGADRQGIAHSAGAGLRILEHERDGRCLDGAGYRAGGLERRLLVPPDAVHARGRRPPPTGDRAHGAAGRVSPSKGPTREHLRQEGPNLCGPWRPLRAADYLRRP